MDAKGLAGTLLAVMLLVSLFGGLAYLDSVDPCHQRLVVHHATVVEKRVEVRYVNQSLVGMNSGHEFDWTTNETRYVFQLSDGMTADVPQSIYAATPIGGSYDYSIQQMVCKQ